MSSQGFTREFLGDIVIKNGALIIHDAGTGALPVKDLKAVYTAGFLGVQGGLAVATQFQDGTYSVYGTRNDLDELISLELDLRGN